MTGTTKKDGHDALGNREAERPVPEAIGDIEYALPCLHLSLMVNRVGAKVNIKKGSSQARVLPHPKRDCLLVLVLAGCDACVGQSIPHPA